MKQFQRVLKMEARRGGSSACARLITRRHAAEAVVRGEAGAALPPFKCE